MSFIFRGCLSFCSHRKQPKRMLLGNSSKQYAIRPCRLVLTLKLLSGCEFLVSAKAAARTYAQVWLERHLMPTTGHEGGCPLIVAGCHEVAINTTIEAGPLNVKNSPSLREGVRHDHAEEMMALSEGLPSSHHQLRLSLCSRESNSCLGYIPISNEYTVTTADEPVENEEGPPNVVFLRTLFLGMYSVDVASPVLQR